MKTQTKLNSANLACMFLIAFSKELGIPDRYFPLLGAPCAVLIYLSFRWAKQIKKEREQNPVSTPSPIQIRWTRVLICVAAAIGSVYFGFVENSIIGAISFVICCLDLWLGMELNKSKT